MMKKHALVAAAVGTLAVSSVAHAGGARVGGNLELLPVGTISASDGSDSESADLDPAFGIGGSAELDVHPNVSVGAAPRFILGVKTESSEKSAKELDLMLRVTAHVPVSPTMQLYGYASPGYSMIFLPDNDDENPKGFALGFGAGAAYAITDRAFVTGELGYQLGFQALKIQGTSLDLTTDYLHLGVGVGTTL
jgi:outer membrane protein with beta-barrel domain